MTSKHSSTGFRMMRQLGAIPEPGHPEEASPT